MNYLKIVEYEGKYLNSVRDLLLELEDYIVSIDEDHLDQVHEEYWEKKALVDLREVYENNGKCYLAIENEKVVGVIMGIITKYDENDYLDYKCPKRGIVTELIVSSKARGNGIGQQLLNKIENYFKEKKCEYVLIEVFAYNLSGINFYNKKGYHNRMYTMIKRFGTY